MFQKRLSKSPVRKSAYLTLMKHKYSASVRITCRDWRANDFWPHTALKLGICLPCITAASALAFEILASAFLTQLVLLEMSMEVHFPRILGCSISTYCTNLCGAAVGVRLLLHRCLWHLSLDVTEPCVRVWLVFLPSPPPWSITLALELGLCMYQPTHFQVEHYCRLVASPHVVALKIAAVEKGLGEISRSW